MKNHRGDILFVFGVAIVLWVAYTVRDVLMLIYVIAIFAVVLSPAIGMIQKLRLNSWRAGRGFAIIFLILMLALAGTLFAVFALPPVYRDSRAFSADWPRHMADLSDTIRRLPFASKIDPASLQKYAAEIAGGDRKSTRLNSSHANISYAVFCLKKKTKKISRPIHWLFVQLLGADFYAGGVRFYGVKNVESLHALARRIRVFQISRSS